MDKSPNSSKLPYPVEATALRILIEKTGMTDLAVIEFDTAANPIRVAVNRQQLEQLVSDATAAIRRPKV